MGAGQSSKLQLADSFERCDLQQAGKSSKSKHSFTKHQLNRLLRKGVASQQAAGEQQHQPADAYFVSAARNAKSDQLGEQRDLNAAANSMRPFNELEVTGSRQPGAYCVAGGPHQLASTLKPASRRPTHQLEQTSAAHFHTLQQSRQQIDTQTRLFNCPGAQALGHKAQGQLKSSCSPSSAGSSSSSSASGFHEFAAGHSIGHARQIGATQLPPPPGHNANANANNGRRCESRGQLPGQAVAMQQHHARPQHQRASSGGGSLSWWKQAGHEQRRQPPAQLDSLELQLDGCAQQPRPSADAIEEFYARNLHLLTGPPQPADFGHFQQQPPPFLSAPQPRRQHKWPEPQLQRLAAQQNNPAASSTLSRRAGNKAQQPISADWAPADESPIYCGGGETRAQRHGQFGELPTGRARAATIASKPARRSRNPLAAIFAPAHQNQAEPQQKHANTLNLAASKSQQNLQAARNSTGGSLKRVKSTPLTAQQSSYEAMRTIDMYLIRQIARSCMDFEMEQKIELEIRLRELAAQSMLEARDEIDVLEVEKSLLTSDQRMNCYASQLEQQRKQLSNPSLSTDSGRASKTSQRGRRDNSLSRARAAAVGASTNADVIGQPTRLGAPGELMSGQSSGGSPSFCSLSKSSQSSPSKLSPVSGESANSESIGAGDEAPRQRSRRSNAQVVRGPSAGSNTLNRRRTGLSNKSSDCSAPAASGPAARLAKQRARLRQSITSQSNINCNMVADCRASVSLSELRIPLMWRDVDHFKGRGDYRRYAVFCLLKVGAQIYDTQLISNVDRQLTDLTFDDMIVFSNVGHEFELELEVYSCVYLEQFSLASTPRKLKEKLSNSVSRAMGRRLSTQTTSANFAKELEAYAKSYRFAMIASAKLTLADASNTTKTYDLHLVSPEAHGRHATAGQLGQASNYSPSSGGQLRRASPMVTASNQRDLHKNTLPLFGHFCCRLHVRPDVFDKCVKSGYLRIAAINLPDTIVASEGTAASDVGRRCQRVRGRSDSPDNDDCGKISSWGDDLNKSDTTKCPNAPYDTSSMLRSALAASSKLATISMSAATVHWALLRNFTLHLWQVDEQELEQAARRGYAPQVDISCKQPFCIPIDKFARLLRVSNSSLTIETERGCFVVAVHNLKTNQHQNDEIGQWLRPIEQMIYDSHIWGAALRHYPATNRVASL